jgi:hypothetical protein
MPEKRVYRFPDPPGPMARALARPDLTPQERSQMKAQAHVNSFRDLTFAVGDVVITLAEKPKVDRQGRLEVVIESAVHAPTGLKYGLDNPYYFVNAPLTYRDGTFYQAENGEDVENRVEDPWTVLKSIIHEAIMEKIR